MFENMKSLNKVVNRKIIEIEDSVFKAETLLCDEVNKVINQRNEITKLMAKKKAAERLAAELEAKNLLDT